MTIHAIESFCRSAAPLAANHLWQSTLFAAAVAAVAWAFRKYDARVRFGLWMAASLKFLVPFAWLIALGNRLAQIHPSTGSPAGIYAVVEQVGQPFHQTAQPADAAGYWLLLPAVVAALWLLGTLAVLCSWAIRWGRISILVRQAQPMIQGREIDALRRLQQAIGIDKPVTLLLSHGPMEPGIFGIFRPALLLPEGITEHLSEDHLRAILAHELCTCAAATISPLHFICLSKPPSGFIRWSGGSVQSCSKNANEPAMKKSCSSAASLKSMPKAC